jgi:hypothetical protein
MLTRYGASARGARARRSYDRIMETTAPDPAAQDTTRQRTLITPPKLCPAAAHEQRRCRIRSANCPALTDRADSSSGYLLECLFSG